MASLNRAMVSSQDLSPIRDTRDRANGERQSAFNDSGRVIVRESETRSGSGGIKRAGTAADSATHSAMLYRFFIALLLLVAAASAM